MQTRKNLRELCALVLVMFGMIGGAGATSANTDLSDIWFDPYESGWGMQMVNTGTFVFATLYVYGQNNGAPIWFTGQLTKTGAAQITYSGPLYATTGPYFGGSFNTDAVTGRQVGTMTFVPTTVTDGQLNYSVDSTIVNKSVQRQQLTLDDYSGNYTAIVTYTHSGCFNPANNVTATAAANIRITQNGPSIALALSTPGSADSCSIVGTYSQLGRMGHVSANSSCTNGAVGTSTWYEMTNTTSTFTARVLNYTPADGCSEISEITGLIPR